MIHRPYSQYLVPTDIFTWDDPGVEWFKQHKLYPFLHHIDPGKVSIYLNVNYGVKGAPCQTPVAVYTMFGEAPTLHHLEAFCDANPEVQVIFLADLDMYDWKLRPQVTFFPYRQWIWYIDFIINSKIFRPLDAKQKHIRWKFSSLSYKITTYRALVTAYLLANAHDQSLISWHGVYQQNPGMTMFMHNDRFTDIDWSLLHQTHLIDEYSQSLNNPVRNMFDINGAQYSETLINLTNETLVAGWQYHGPDLAYTQPGPYLTEKTWKCLLTGCVPLSVGQPGFYTWLSNQYHIANRWSIPSDYDTVIGDIDRAGLLLDALQYLIDQPLHELIDANIDYCQQIQQQILDPGYLDAVYAFNRMQDKRILETIHQIII